MGRNGVGKGKKEWKGREGARGRNEKRDGEVGKGEGKKGSGKGLLAIPTACGAAVRTNRRGC